MGSGTRELGETITISIKADSCPAPPLTLPAEEDCARLSPKRQVREGWKKKGDRGFYLRRGAVHGAVSFILCWLHTATSGNSKTSVVDVLIDGRSRDRPNITKWKILFLGFSHDCVSWMRGIMVMLYRLVDFCFFPVLIHSHFLP